VPPNATGLPAAPRPDVLVIGIGNSARGDDGVGPAVVARLDRTSSTLAVHQLLPELAPRLAECTRVVFVDAEVGPPPGTVSVRRLEPIGPGRRSTPGSLLLGHALSPEHLIALTFSLFRRAPEAWLVSIGARRFEDDTLSEDVLPAVDVAVERVRTLLSPRP
jgi:hydrogenase maturation protease